jgi:hypothetical protein
LEAGFDDATAFWHCPKNTGKDFEPPTAWNA